MTLFTMTFTATPDDIDELGHVNNAVWVRWVQAIGRAHWEAVASVEHVKSYAWVVTRHEIDYRGTSPWEKASAARRGSASLLEVRASTASSGSSAETGA